MDCSITNAAICCHGKFEMTYDMRHHEIAGRDHSLLIGPGIPRRTPSAAKLPVQQAMTCFCHPHNKLDDFEANVLKV